MKPIQHWKCEICKGYNDILNMSCVFCKADKPTWITAKYQMSVEFDRGIYDAHGILASHKVSPAKLEGRVKRIMTPNEELHAKFFSEEAVLVLDMTDADLDEHLHELETIAREAKARILAASEEKRTRAAKSGNKKWRVEPLGPDPTVTDSLNKVKQRSARMSKLDSMRTKMSAIGLSDFEIDQMLAKMVAQARKEPDALKKENELKGKLKEPQPPSIITDEERDRRIAERKRLDAKDKEDEKVEKEREAQVANKKDETLIATEETPAVVPAPNPFEPNNGKQDEKKSLFDLFAKLEKK